MTEQTTAAIEILSTTAIGVGALIGFLRETLVSLRAKNIALLLAAILTGAGTLGMFVSVAEKVL